MISIVFTCLSPPSHSKLHHLICNMLFASANNGFRHGQFRLPRMCGNPKCVAAAARLRRRMHHTGNLRLEDIGSTRDIWLTILYLHTACNQVLVLTRAFSTRAANSYWHRGTASHLRMVEEDRWDDRRAPQSGRSSHTSDRDLSDRKPAETTRSLCTLQRRQPLQSRHTHPTDQHHQMGRYQIRS